MRCEPPAPRLENVRFLSGYRRDWLFDLRLLARLRRAGLVGATLAGAFGCLPELPGPLVRAAVLHLVWAGYFITDPDHPAAAFTGPGCHSVPLWHQCDPARWGYQCRLCWRYLPGAVPCCRLNAAANANSDP